MGLSYTPMAEYEVVLRVHIPVMDPEPREWDWPGLTDTLDEHLQFRGQRLVRTYNVDEDGERTEVVEHDNPWTAARGIIPQGSELPEETQRRLRDEEADRR